ncbi:hypothetical protein RJ639_020546 [Escallonia herrerae]|uniref:Uncharacterized protein n=1 Tax=Escallonia herrerae TaxID=1293975 RepID=A0AA89AH98_9ASTE|nr:hypothetical protein RJ639_020546 [Escallonia herrerae]
MASAKDSDSSLGYLTRKETEVKLPRPTRVKNKTPAPIQITAEQILREARERQEAEIRPPKQKITDPTELADYRLRKRKEYEDLIRRVRWNKSVWVKYAKWEESQKDFNRARSVWERALDVDYRDHTMWLKYADVEMKNKFINHARNVWDRAVTLLPRVDQLWYKYIHMEEMLGNVAGARQIFERWMSWEPDQQAWLSYIKFELRYNEIERARAIFERFVACQPKVSSWIRFAKFEMKNGEIGRARGCYERAVDKLADDEEAETLFVAFAEFEEKCKETERARCIYKFALDHIPKGRAEDLYRKFVGFEKQYGDREGIEDAIVGKRRFQYEDEVRKNPLNYDSWFDYIRLEESGGNKERIREVYERAIANVPPAEEKRYWQRYIYLWINYALYEELDAQDMERTRAVYRECRKLIPHQKFSFAKIWLMAAQFEIRQLNLDGARLILGNAIGQAPKDKIFKKYIEIELQLGNIDRCRKLYEKYLEWSPENCYAWSKFAELERSLSETERARAIFELAIAQPALDMPELLWKAYIDFEISEGEFERTRQLYERLLDRTKHLKVWISYAKFEASALEEDEQALELPEDDAQESLREKQQQCLQRARRVFESGINYYRTSAPELKEERAMLLEEWHNMESSFGELGDVDLVKTKLPKKLKKRRYIETEDGPAGFSLAVTVVTYFWRITHVYNLHAVGTRAGRTDPPQPIREHEEQVIRNVDAAGRLIRDWRQLVVVVPEYGYLWCPKLIDAPNIVPASLECHIHPKIRCPETCDVLFLLFRECRKLIPHQKSPFAKIWLMAAQIEIRQLNLDGARLILGNAIGQAPKDKIFKKYIEIELQLANIDRCRKLYEKYLEWSPENCYAWSKFAELERSLSETERARAIFELAIAQPALDMPELLWKAYIDFEISEGEFERTRQLYERLLDRTKHLKVWISYSKFEASALEEDEQALELPEDDAQESLREKQQQCLQRARSKNRYSIQPCYNWVFESRINYYRTPAPELKEEHAMLLEEWHHMESSFGELGDVNLVKTKLPKKLKKRRYIEIEDGPAGQDHQLSVIFVLFIIAFANKWFEEYIDYIFPGDLDNANLKILEAAYKWKKQKLASNED